MKIDISHGFNCPLFIKANFMITYHVMLCMFDPYTLSDTVNQLISLLINL